MSLGVAELGMSLGNIVADDDNSPVRRANNFAELLGYGLEESGFANSSAILYYSQEMLEVATAVHGTYKFVGAIKNKEWDKVLPKGSLGQIENAKRVATAYSASFITTAKVAGFAVESLYDLFIAETPSQSLRNLDLESWKSTVEFLSLIHI